MSRHDKQQVTGGFKVYIYETTVERNNHESDFIGYRKGISREKLR